MKALFKMNFDCGRNGSLEGVFVAEKEDVDFLIKNKVGVYFGEVLGKHSDVYGYVDKSEIKLITYDEIVIDIFIENGLECGYNPLEYNLCESETDGVPENGIEWGDYTVQEFIDFKTRGVIPKGYSE